MNVVDNTPRTDLDEIINYTRKRQESTFENAGRAEKLRWMINIIVLMTRPRDLLVDFTARILSAMESCTPLPRHRRFTGCDKDQHCVAAASPSVANVFAKQIWHSTSDIEVSDSIKQAAGLFMKAFSASKTFQRHKFWVAPKR